MTRVTDAVSSLRNKAFKYNVNGSAMSLDSLKVTLIEYSHLNLPKKFVRGSENLLYTYDANGKKLTKTLGTSITQYIDGIQYKNGTIEFIQTEEGRILPNGTNFVYEYFLKDHLGNVRVVVDNNGIVKQIQDYYAFGKEMNPGNAYNSGLVNNLKYNGKEKQQEFGLNQLDYGMRFYDAEIDRWNVVDPVSEMFFSPSPYSYSFNNPVNFEDFDGMAPQEGGNIDPTKLYGKKLIWTKHLRVLKLMQLVMLVMLRGFGSRC